MRLCVCVCVSVCVQYIILIIALYVYICKSNIFNIWITLQKQTFQSENKSILLTPFPDYFAYNNFYLSWKSFLI